MIVSGLSRRMCVGRWGLAIPAMLLFQIFPVDDVSRRIERLTAVKRHDVMVNVIHHVDVVVLRVAARVRAGDHVIQRQQRMILGQRLVLVGSQTRRRNLTRGQRVNQRRFVHNRAARG